jgi:hypothetical protein
VARGHGWYGFGLTSYATAACLAGLADAATRVERPASLGRLEITVTPRGRLTADKAAAFADLGVDRLVPTTPPSAEGARGAIEGAVEAVAALG